MTTPGKFREIEHPRDRLGRFIEKDALVSILGGGTGRVLGSAPHGKIDVLRSDGRTVRLSPGHLSVTQEPPTRVGGPKPLPASPVQQPDEAEGPDLFSAAVPQNPDVGPQTGGREAVQNVMAADEDPDDDDAEVSDEDWRKPPVEFEFEASRLAEAINKIEIANRRAERAGIAERFGFTIERFEVTRTTDKDGNRLAFPYIEERVRLTLDRPQVQHDGWTFVATLSWDPEAGLVTRVVPDATLNRRPEARHCDVCNSQRDRKDTYVVQDASGDEKQVGSNCLTHFLGIRPSNLWMMDWSPDVGEDEDERGGGGGRTEDSRYETVGLLRLALAVVSKSGWVSRGQASADYSKRATADIMQEYMGGRLHSSKDAGDRAYAADIDNLIADGGPLEEEAVAVRDFARTIDGDSEYVINLRAVAAADSVSSRNVALLASAVAAKRRNDGYVAERAAREKATGDSKHVGEVGGKVADVPVKITGIKMIDGDYGMSTLLSFIDGEGNVYKWFASGVKDEFELGDDVLVSGTIKKHGEFRGVKETNLTRAKLKATGDRGAAEAAEEARIKAEAAAAKKAAKTAVPPGYVAYDGQAPLTVGMTVRILDPDARTKVKPYIDVVIRQEAAPPGSPLGPAYYVARAGRGGTMAVVVRPEDVVAVRGPETKTSPQYTGDTGVHVDYRAPSEPGKQTAVPPGLARTAMSSPTEEYEIAIPDERWKREGGHDEAFKGLEPVDAEADDEDDEDTPAGEHDASLFDAEPERKAALIGRGSHVAWDGGRGRVDLVILEGRLPGVAESPLASKWHPLARVVLDDGSKVAVSVEDLDRDEAPPEPAVKGAYAALNALIEEKALPLGLTSVAVSQAYGRGLKGWPGERVTSLSQQAWALGRARALVSAAAGSVIAGFADGDLLPK